MNIFNLFKNSTIKETQEEKIPPEILKKVRNIELRSKHLVSESMSGGYNSVFRGYGMEFEEVREYFPGDDYRRIDWNVTSRYNTPYIKIFREERQLNVMLLIDLSGSIGYGSSDSTKRDKLIETASVISFTALANQDKIGAVFFTDQVEKSIIPSKNKNNILRMIRDILFFKPKHSKTDINIAIDYTVENIKRRGVIIIFSDFYTAIDYKKIFIASKKHDIIPVVLSDINEVMPVGVGLVDMIDNETGELMLLDTNSAYYKDMIKKRIAEREELFEQFKKFSIEPMLINTSDDIENVIIRYFHKRLKKR